MANLLWEFSRQPLILGLVFYVISIVCLRRALDKIHNAKFFAHGKTFTHRKIKSGRNSFGEKKEEKKELYASVHISNKEVIVKPKFAIHNVKNKVSFYLCKYQLDTNRNFERCLSIRCLAPQHIFQFFHFSLWYSLLGL